MSKVLHRLLNQLLLCAILGAAPKTLLAQADKAADRRTIVILGDSLAAGYGLDRSQAFPALIQKKIDEAGLKYEVINAGVSGDTSAGGLRRIDWLLKRHTDVLVLELGGNDGLRGITPESTRTNLTGIIRKLKEKNPQAKVIVAGMQMPPNMGPDYTEKFRKVFSEVAVEHKTALVPFLLEGVGGVRELNQSDGIHPTAKGQEILAENVWKVMKPVLSESPSLRGKAEEKVPGGAN